MSEQKLSRIHNQHTMQDFTYYDVVKDMRIYTSDVQLSFSFLVQKLWFDIMVM